MSPRRDDAESTQLKEGSVSEEITSNEGKEENWRKKRKNVWLSFPEKIALKNVWKWDALLRSWPQDVHTSSKSDSLVAFGHFWIMFVRFGRLWSFYRFEQIQIVSCLFDQSWSHFLASAVIGQIWLSCNLVWSTLAIFSRMGNDSWLFLVMLDLDCFWLPSWSHLIVHCFLF